MAEGPLGGPRPLASGDVVLLMTTENSILGPSSLQRNMRDVGRDVSVELDSGVNTYGINTGLDSVSLNELNELASTAEDLYTGEVIGFSIGFQ